MRKDIERVKQYRTLGATSKQEYVKEYLIPQVLTENYDNQTVVNHSNLLQFLISNFRFSNPRFSIRGRNLVVFPDSKLVVDNNEKAEDTSVFFGGWTVIRLRDILISDGVNREDLFKQLFHRVTAHLSKVLMLSSIYHQMTMSYAALGTCNRLSVGALIVKDGRVISTGTNGSVQGMPSCKDEGCLLDHGHCIRTIHAEQNSILFTSRAGISISDSVMYCTDMPCVRCLGMIAQSGIKGIYFERDYDDGFNKKLASKLGSSMEFYQYDGSMYRLINSQV